MTNCIPSRLTSQGPVRFQVSRKIILRNLRPVPQKIPDPRSKRGVSQPFRTVLAIVFLGLLANLSTLAETERWANIHLAPLKQFLRLRHHRKGQDERVAILEGQNFYNHHSNPLALKERHSLGSVTPRWSYFLGRDTFAFQGNFPPGKFLLHRTG